MLESETLQKFLESEDFMKGVLMATKASWQGEKYSVELFAKTGTWRLRAHNQIGFLSTPQGRLIVIPPLDTKKSDPRISPSIDTINEYLELLFTVEEDNIRALMYVGLLEAWKR